MQMVTSAMKLKDTFSWEENYNQPRQCIKKQRHEKKKEKIKKKTTQRHY